jgi:hypothetical protein
MKTHNPLKQIKERRFLDSIPSFFLSFLEQIRWKWWDLCNLQGKKT